MSDSFVTLWTVACQASLSMEFSMQEYWSSLPFPPPGHLPDPGINPTSLTLADGFFTTASPRKPLHHVTLSFLRSGNCSQELCSDPFPLGASYVEEEADSYHSGFLGEKPSHDRTVKKLRLWNCNLGSGIVDVQMGTGGIIKGAPGEWGGAVTLNHFLTAT